MTKRLFIMLGALVVLLGALGAACTSDTGDLEDRIAAIEAQLQDGSADEADIGAMLAGLNLLGGAGLHGLDEATAAGEIPEGAGGGVDDAILAVAATTWPAELQAPADALLSTLQELRTALESGDAAAAAGPAADAHEAWHDFDHEAVNFIKAAVGLEAEEHDEDMDMTTPEGDMEMTPEAGG
jgi:hypothetical protein